MQTNVNHGTWLTDTDTGSLRAMLTPNSRSVSCELSQEGFRPLTTSAMILSHQLYMRDPRHAVRQYLKQK